MDLKDPQIRSLRWSILGRICLTIVIFTVVYLGVLFVFELFLKPLLAYALRWEEVGGGGIYAFLNALYLPLCFVIYLVGVILIVRSGVTRALEYFAQLFGAVESLMRRDEKPITLAPELSRTAVALNAVKEESEKNMRAAKAAEDRKNELVVYLAHDIKTPLTSIIGYLTLLDEAPEMPLEQRARYTSITLDKAYRLEGLLEEFFDITRYNLQSIPIERLHFDACVLCEQVIEEFYPQAQARSLDIRLASPAELPVFADGGRVARILNNVLKNAIAYADEGTEVTVSADMTTIETGKRYLSVTVTNRGREIAPHHLQHVFEKFYRGDESRGSSSGGAGLGLAIAHEIARAHGGDITAASDRGVTSFTVWIPQD